MKKGPLRGHARPYQARERQGERHNIHAQSPQETRTRWSPYCDRKALAARQNGSRYVRKIVRSKALRTRSSAQRAHVDVLNHSMHARDRVSAEKTTARQSVREREAPVVAWPQMDVSQRAHERFKGEP
jgi:hypothetical protein